MSGRRDSFSHAVSHLSGLALLGGIAWVIGISHETLGIGLLLIVAIVALCWGVLATVWWLLGLLFRSDD